MARFVQRMNECFITSGVFLLIQSNCCFANLDRNLLFDPLSVFYCMDDVMFIIYFKILLIEITNSFKTTTSNS